MVQESKLIKIENKENKFITADEEIKLYYEWKIKTDFVVFWKHDFQNFFTEKISEAILFFSWLKNISLMGFFFLKENNFKQKKIRIHLEYLR